MKIGHAALGTMCAIPIFLLLLLPGPSTAAEVSFQLAQQISSNFLSHHVAVYGTWAGSGFPTISESETIIYKGLPVAYNFKISPSGHILVSYWDHLSPILLYSATSDFQPARVNESASIESWVIPSLYHKTNELVVGEESIEEVVSQSDARVAKAWEWLGVESSSFSPDADGYGFEFSTVGPLLSTSWAQGEPYNQLCPPVPGTCSETLVGSVATAWAQIMKYWNWPIIGTGSHSYSWKGTTLSADFNTTYDWSNMPNQLTDSSSSEEKAAVAKICYHVGIAAQTNYGCACSNSYLYADEVLDVYFKYKPSMEMHSRGPHSEREWFNYFKMEFDATPPRPVAFSIVSLDGSSHEAVADGYQTGATNMVHVNFGWAGAYDGYYDITNDFTTGSETWKRDNQLIITHIEPDRPETILYYSDYDGYNTIIYSIDTTSSDDSPLVTWPGVELTGLSESPIANSIYGVDSLSQQLVSVNLSSMSFAVIAALSFDIKELAYDCDRMMLYGTDQENLYTIDTSTGIASLVGSFGSGLSVMRALAYDKKSSTLWGVDAYTDQLYRISAKTGLATAIGPTEVDSIGDIFVHQSSGKIYGVGNGERCRYLYTLDKSTGMATQVAIRQISGSNALGLAAPCSESLSAPSLTVTTSGTTVTLSWNSVYNADGYAIYYAPYPDLSYIHSIDMGTQTGGSFVLWKGAAFYVAVKSYNSYSYSDYSNIEHFVILPNCRDVQYEEP